MRVSRVVTVFVILEALQVLVMTTTGVASSPTRGIWVFVLLTLWLAYRSFTAWVILLLCNALPLLLAFGLMFGSGTMWGHVAVLFLTCGLLVATLLSAPMREHVGGRRRVLAAPSA